MTRMYIKWGIAIVFGDTRENIHQEPPVPVKDDTLHEHESILIEMILVTVLCVFGGVLYFLRHWILSEQTHSIQEAHAREEKAQWEKHC